MFQDLARRMASRGNGMGMYFSMIDPTRERFPGAPGASVPQTPRMEGGATPRMEGGATPRMEGAMTPRGSAPGSRVGSPERTDESAGRESDRRRSRSHSRQVLHQASRNRVGHHRQHGHHHHDHHRLLHHALLPVRSSRFEHAVGVFESQKYLNLEATKLRDPLAEEYTAQTTTLLNDRWG